MVSTWQVEEYHEVPLALSHYIDLARRLGALEESGDSGASNYQIMVTRLHPSAELDPPRLRLGHCALQLQATRHLLLRLWWGVSTRYMVHGRWYMVVSTWYMAHGEYMASRRVSRGTARTLTRFRDAPPPHPHPPTHSLTHSLTN